MTPRDLRLFLILAGVVSKQLKAAGDLYRGELIADTTDDPDDAMAPGERRTVHVRGPDGERVKVGHVRVDQAPVTVAVTDEAAFTAWVQETAPGEIVPAVRDSYRRRVLDVVKREGRAPHPVTGELVDVPGVSREIGDPRVVVSPVAGAAGLLADAHARGVLPQLGGFMREIGPGGGDLPDPSFMPPE